MEEDSDDRSRSIGTGQRHDTLIRAEGIRIRMEGERLMISIGVDDFGKLREGGFYYVDKTELISDIVGNMKEVFLFTRPRRFGKTLNLSMLDCFFNLKYRGNHWFEGLKVMDDPKAVSGMNGYPVIRLAIAGLKTNSYESFFSDFKGVLNGVYRDFEYLKKSDRISDLDRQIYFETIPEFYNPTSNVF